MMIPRQVNNDAELILKTAVQEAVAAIQGVTVGGAVASAYAGMAAKQTSSEEDEDGNVHTVHAFMLGVDALGDPYAPLMVRGNTIDYRG